MSDDPAGYYARLEVEPDAAPEAITAAFRRKARVLHPDVSQTGDAAAFIRVKEAYDVLGDAARRAAYDRAARAMAAPDPVPAPAAPPIARGPRLSDLPVALWAGLGGLFCLAAAMAVIQFMRPPASVPVVAARPFAPPPLPSRRLAPVHAAAPAPGMATHYVLPAGGAAVLWRRDAERDAFLPGGRLADFTPVRALRLVPEHGLVEIGLAEGGSGYVDAARLAPGDQSAAHRSYCTYNAGPPPQNGEILGRHGAGTASFRIDNRGVQPAVVKLRDVSDLAIVSVFVAPGGSITVTGLPDVQYHAEFAVGELWSRACHAFAAGMRAQSLPGDVRTPLAVPPALSAASPPVDISDAAFERE